MPTWSSGVTLRGKDGTAIRSGMGPPSSTAPAKQVDGDFYFDISSSVPVLYGPRANGVWPSTGVSAGGTLIRDTTGAPAPTLGVIGDYAIDRANGFLYGPKTADGWFSTTPVSIVGPAGPSGLVQPAFGTFSAGYGPAGYVNGQSLTSTAVQMNIGAVNGVPHIHVPVTASAFMGAQVVNFGNSAAQVFVQLWNNTTSTNVWTSPSAITVGSVTNFGPFTSTAYPLTAGSSYSLRISGSGVTNAYVVPLYLYQCGAAQGVSTYAPFSVSNATLTAAGATMLPAGFTANTMYYRAPTTGYLYSMQVYATGTASASVTFGGYTTTAVTAANSPQTFGPFVAASNTLAANTNYTATVKGSGTGSVVMIPNVVA